jgi:Tfp pilus assembly protein PilF
MLSTACISTAYDQPAEALRVARDNVAGPHAPADLILLGACQLRAGQPAEAIVTLDRAVKLQGEFTAELQLLLALACVKQGQPDRAGKWLAQAVLRDNLDWTERLRLERLRDEASWLLQSLPRPKR